MPDDLQLIKAVLKRELARAKWWEYVREDVRTQIYWIIHHLEEVGCLYRDCFDYLFKYEHAIRCIDGFTESDSMLLPVNMSGYSINEESYQCGKLPVKMLLHLEDVFEPNDAEVQACLYVCHQIDILKASGYIKPSKYQSKTPAEIKLQQIIEEAVKFAKKQVDHEPNN